MKNQTKLIVIVTMIALLMCVVISLAVADEKIYTSPTFKLPADQIKEWAEEQPEGEVPEEVSPEEGTPEEGAPEEGEPEEEWPEDGRVEDEAETPAEGTEAQSEEGNVVGETVQPERSVQIRSSQGDVVTEGEIIYLTSKLKGFDGLDIAYQWQVDRGDGEGWVDVEGANRPKHMFVADRETIQYSWRLVVSILDEE